MKDFDFCDDAWLGCHGEDRWIFNKLELARRLGYKAGPAGLDVQEKGEYIVRPCINIKGMGRSAKVYFLNKETNHLPDGSFWCERFYGRHYSVDYQNEKQILTVEGKRKKEDEDILYKWASWEIVDKDIPPPEIIMPLFKKYKTINVEFIEDKIIEIHLRGNQDFKNGIKKIYPVWKEDGAPVNTRNFIKDRDWKRLGFIFE